MSEVFSPETKFAPANPTQAAFDEHIGMGFRRCIDTLTDSFEIIKAALSKAEIEKARGGSSNEGE